MPSLWELLCVSRQKYSTHRVGSVQPQSAGVAERPDLEHDRSGHRRPIWSESAYGTDPASGKPDNQQQPRPTHSLVDRKGISDYTQDSPSMPGRDITKNNFIDSSGQSVTGFSSPTSAPREHAKRNYDDDDDDDDARNKKDGRRRHVQDIFNEGGFARRSKPKAAAGKAGASSEAGGSRGDDSADDPAAARARQSVAPERDSSSHQSTSKTALVVSKPCRGPTNSRPYNDDNNNIESKARNKKGIRTDNMAHYAPRSVVTRDASEVLFGHRLDDFVHNPDWNRNMERFAALPSANMSIAGHSSVGRQHLSSAESFEQDFSVIGKTGSSEPRGQITIDSTTTTSDFLGSAPAPGNGSSQAGINDSNCNYASPSDSGAPSTDCSGFGRNQLSSLAGAATTKHKKAYYVDDFVVSQGLRRNSQASDSRGSGLDETYPGTDHEDDVLY